MMTPSALLATATTVALMALVLFSTSDASMRDEDPRCLACPACCKVPGAPYHKQPVFEYVRTIAYEPENNLRDPSSVVQDPVTGRWHFWVDWMPGGQGPGWHARLKHFSAPADAFDGAGPSHVSNISNITGNIWTNHGFALNLSVTPTAADSAGQFSSSVIYDAEEKTWWLFYSASSANQSTMLTNSQMVCSSPSPDGPWTRRGLAAWPTGSPATNWSSAVTATPSCRSGQKHCWNARFTDSGRAMIIGGQRAYWTEGVEGGYATPSDPHQAYSLVASEGVYLPHSSGSFAPPYHEKPETNPVYPPFGKQGEESGYENCEFFMGSEDGLLHILCTWDGGTLGPPGLLRGAHPHFIVDLKQDPLGQNWTYVGAIHVASPNRPANSTVPMAGEPTPVYEGGAPGDQARVRYFIAREDAVTHGGPGSLRIGLFKLLWIDPSLPTPTPSPGPAAEQKCPSGWTTHASGFWRNTEPCPNNHWAGCTPDSANQTVGKCALKCRRTKGCMAIVVPKTLGAGDCYIFINKMEAPFTPYPSDLACVRPA